MLFRSPGSRSFRLHLRFRQRRFGKFLVRPWQRRQHRLQLHQHDERNLFGGAENAWVESRGVIRSVEPTGTEAYGDDRARLVLDTGNGRFRVMLPGYPPGAALPESLIDAEVQIRGVFGSVFNDRRQLIGVQILCPGMITALGSVSA